MIPRLVVLCSLLLALTLSFVSFPAFGATADRGTLHEDRLSAPDDPVSEESDEVEMGHEVFAQSPPPTRQRFRHRFVDPGNRRP